MAQYCATHIRASARLIMRYHVMTYYHYNASIFQPGYGSGADMFDYIVPGHAFEGFALSYNHTNAIISLTNKIDNHMISNNINHMISFDVTIWLNRIIFLQ